MTGLGRFSRLTRKRSEDAETRELAEQDTMRKSLVVPVAPEQLFEEYRKLRATPAAAREAYDTLAAVPR